MPRSTEANTFVRGPLRCSSVITIGVCSGSGGGGGVRPDTPQHPRGLAGPARNRNMCPSGRAYVHFRGGNKTWGRPPKTTPWPMH